MTLVPHATVKDGFNRGMIRCSVVLAAIFMPFGSGSPMAATVSSRYTDVDGMTCRTLRNDEESCPALPGYKVTVSDNGNLGQVVIAPRSGATSALFQAQKLGAKLEWRVRSVGSRVVPYAAILRLTLINGTDPIGEALGIAKLAAEGSCVIGFVDVHSNANANALAEQAADERTASFDCAHDSPKRIGTMSSSLAEHFP